MHNDEFEKEFSDFLDCREYDQAESALFAMVRIAFTAGWRAAGGPPPRPRTMLRLIHKKSMIQDTTGNGFKE